MKYRTIFDLLEQYPSFQYEEAKKEGYTDEEILVFLSSKENDSTNVFSYTETSWSNVESFSKDFPIYFWSSISLMTILLFFLIIKIFWKLIKAIIYQIAYTITKAIRDANQ